MPIIIENLTHTYMPGSVTQFTALHDINLTVEAVSYTHLTLPTILLV